MQGPALEDVGVAVAVAADVLRRLTRTQPSCRRPESAGRAASSAPSGLPFDFTVASFVLPSLAVADVDVADHVGVASLDSWATESKAT